MVINPYFFLNKNNKHAYTYLLCSILLHRAAPSLFSWGVPLTLLAPPLHRAPPPRKTAFSGGICASSPPSPTATSIDTDSGTRPSPPTLVTGFDWQQPEALAAINLSNVERDSGWSHCTCAHRVIGWGSGKKRGENCNTEGFSTLMHSMHYGKKTLRLYNHFNDLKSISN